MEDFSLLLKNIWNDAEVQKHSTTYSLNEYGQGCQGELMTTSLFQQLESIKCDNQTYLLISKGKIENLQDVGNVTARSSEGGSILGSPLSLVEYDLPSSQNDRSTTSPAVFYKPCTVGEARKILSTYQLSAQLESVPSLPVYVLCDGSPPEHIVVMSSEVIKQSSSSYCFKSTDVTVKSPVNGSLLLSELGAVQKSHLKNTGCTKQFTVKCSAAYHNFGLVNVDDDVMNKSQGKMSIHFEWDRLSLSLNPPVESKAVVHITLVDGDMRSAAYNIYQELSALLELVHGLELEELHSKIKGSSQATADRVKQLITDSKTGAMTNLKGLQSEEDADSSFCSAIAKLSRTDLDFTEQLWMILKDCQNNKELVECFRCVLHQLQMGQIQPMVHNSNKTELANLIRTSYTGQIAIPNLEGIGALKILVDIGIEKLKRDYISIFIGQELVTLNDLLPFINFDDLSLRDRSVNLEKLHKVLELVVLLDKFLSTSGVILSSSARMALKYYAGHDIRQPKTFVVSIPQRLVAGYIEKCNPCEYKAFLSNDLNDGKVQSTVILNNEAPLSCLLFDPLPDEAEKENRTFYLTTVKQQTITI